MCICSWAFTMSVTTLRELSYRKLSETYILSEWNIIWKKGTIKSDYDKVGWRRVTRIYEYLEWICSIQLWPGCQSDDIIVSLKFLNICIFGKWNFTWKKVTINSDCDKVWCSWPPNIHKYFELNMFSAVVIRLPKW